MSRTELSDPVHIQTTALADVWRVSMPDGQFGALKIYHRADMSNEGPGLTFLSALDGRAAARVHTTHENAVLLEWLPGPSLGDLVRQDQDRTAAIHLVKVANEIHEERVPDSDMYPSLENWFDALFALRVSPQAANQTRDDFEYCRDLARHLLSSQTDVRPLHGDLHHDNIRLSDTGFRAFDAKGVVGERGYELANAFRNPKGATELIRDPSRIRHLRDLWSHEFKVPPVRLMQWATVRVALSISWRSSGTLTTDPECDLLSIFRAQIPHG